MSEQDDVPPEDTAPDEIPDAGEPQARSRKKKQDAVLLEERLVLRQVLSTEAGRRFWFRLINEVCLTNQPQTNGVASTDYSLFREGARQVGLDLQTRALRADKDHYIMMLSENLI